MLIANPIYDGAFKFLMKDANVARHFLSILLNRNIAWEGFKPTEDNFRAYVNETGFASQRMDFIATIIEENGTKRKVLIELQKSHTQTDIGRFRRYLAKSYYDQDLVQKNDEHQEIIVIYILGFPLDIPVAVVRTSTKLIDASTQQELDANTDDATFMRQLHHESIFIDVTKLNTKMQTRVDKLLAVFNQSYITAKKYTLDLPTENIALDKDDFLIIERLNLALQDKEISEHLVGEAEFQEEVINMIARGKADLEIIAKKEGKAEGAIQIAKKMKNRNTPMEYIIEDTGLTKEQIEKL